MNANYLIKSAIKLPTVNESSQAATAATAGELIATVHKGLETN